MNNSPLEFLAAKYGNVVKYDAKGNPSIFVKFPRMKSSDLVEGLPDHIHPAFIINGVVQDYILLGKYKAGENGVAGGTLYSMPNIMPVRSVAADDILERMKAAGAGVSGMTVADYGFIKLLAQKHGWDPKGNNNYGVDYRDGTPWKTGDLIYVDDKRCFEGYEYTAKIKHNSVDDFRPDLAPAYWEKGKFLGGISKDTTRVSQYQTGFRTLNGTGPKTWYLRNDVGSMADLIGSSYEMNYGYRIVEGELQILQDNNAADPAADMSASSSAWKAILPNMSDDGYTLVSPGTQGTLHWNYVNDTIILDTKCDDFTSGPKYIRFSALTAHATRLPYVPHIVKELGLFPTDANDTTSGRIYIAFAHGEYFGRRGGSYSQTNRTGLGYLYCYTNRSSATQSEGARPRSL